ncbi:MAG: deoxyribonuclease IV [Candidatus Eremiobacteraeota bacterium]|nr:deoxyribonuclease IV [Candidatus Eremiobacteraeota bacterium]
MVNLASAEPDLYRKSVALVQNDLEIAAKSGIAYVNTHLGSYGSHERFKGLERVCKTVSELARSAKRGPMLLLENSAGAGALCGGTIEELGVIVKAVASKRIGICLDTAHLWASGYDISDRRGVAALLRLADKHIGLGAIAVWHLNDTEVALGARRDRHWHIGRGRIGEAGFASLLRSRLTSQACGICETPKPTEPGFSNLAVLRKLAGARKAASSGRRNIGHSGAV